jgi:hypothetical protein
MKSVEQRLAEKFEELEERGRRTTVVEIIESGRPLETKLAAAERALDGSDSSKKLAEVVRRAFKFTPEQAQVFVEERRIDPFWKAIKEMRD